MRPVFLLALPLLLAATQDAPAPLAKATLNVQQGGTRGADGMVHGGSYKLVKAIDVPADHKIHDTLIAMEGPGWESDKVAYRLYLDERNVPDIYGKKLPGAILPRIGMGRDDYHTLADWGMDIFQVNQTLGMGGIGVMRDGKVTQLGPSAITATAGERGNKAVVLVKNKDFAGLSGPATLATEYSIAPGSRVTDVGAIVVGNTPQMVAGLTLHPGVTKLQSTSGRWRYIATWGKQSLAHDDLGIALFYPADNVGATGENEGTYFVQFCDARWIRYAFAAAWVQEPDAPKDLAGFRAWLDATVAEMDRVRGKSAYGCKG